MVTKATTAAAMGEQVIPTCDATEATAQGRSGPGSHENGEQESHQRSQEGDVFRVLAQQFLGYLDHPVHAARSLQGTCAGDGGDDDVNDIRGRGAGLEAEAENEDGEADAGDGAKSHGSVTGTNVQACQNDEQLYNHQSGHSLVIVVILDKYRNNKANLVTLSLWNLTLVGCSASFF